PERLKVALYIVDDGGPAHAIKIDVEDGSGGPVGIVGRLILHGPLDGNVFAVAGAYHVPRQHDDVPFAVADGIHVQRVGDAEGCRLAGAELAPAGPPRTPLQVLAVYLKKVLEICNRHTAAIVGDADALTARKDRHLNPRRDAR